MPRDPVKKYNIWFTDIGTILRLRQLPWSNLQGISTMTSHERHGVSSPITGNSIVSSSVYLST